VKQFMWPTRGTAFNLLLNSFTVDFTSMSPIFKWSNVDMGPEARAISIFYDDT
jgi:hypothetical protein